jgi:hypothetical protein
MAFSSGTYGSDVVLRVGGRGRLLHPRPRLGVDLEEPEKKNEHHFHRTSHALGARRNATRVDDPSIT